MINKLYIKNNLRKNLSSYINIILIVTASIIIINIMNIYLDSLVYGHKQNALEQTGGYAFSIEPANENDLSLFSNMSETTVEFEDGTIYIKVLEINTIPQIQKIITDIIKSNNLDMNLHSYAELLTESGVANEQIAFFNIMKFVFAVIGVISIYFIYILFIQNKKSDLAILISLGMDNKSLKKLLLTELLIIYALSFLLGLMLSNIIMYFIVSSLLYTTNENLVTVIYKFTFSSTTFLFIVSFASVITAYSISLNKILNIPLIRTIISGTAYSGIKRNVNIWNKASVIKYVSAANLSRNKRPAVICSILTIPVIIICSVFFNYLNLFNLPSEDGDFVIINYSDIYNHADIIRQNIYELQKNDSIDKLDYSVYYNDLLLEENTDKLIFPVYTIYSETGNENYHHVFLKVIKDEAVLGNSYDSDSFESGDGVLLSGNIRSMKYKAGDTIALHDPMREHVGHSHDENGHPEDGGKTPTVAGFMDVPQYDNYIEIYVSERGFEKITGYPAVPNTVDVFLKPEADYDAVKEQIYTQFGDTQVFSILDNIERNQALSRMVRGIALTAAILCGILIIIIIILIAAFINFYIQSQRPQIQTLSALGASKKTLIKISVYESAIKGVFNSVVGLLIGTFISYVVVKMSRYNLYVNHYFFLAYGLIIFLIIAIITLPAYFGVRKIIKPKEVNNVSIADITTNENI